MNDYATCVGIDLARRSNHKAVIVRHDGPGGLAPKRAFSFSHDLEGLEALGARIMKQTGRASLEGVTVNMEPTSGVWEVVAGFLRTRGANVYFTRPDVVSQLRKVHSKFAKTDRIDARTLAGIPASFPERLVPIVEVEPRVRTLRDLSAQRQRLVEDVTRWRNRFSAKVEVVWSSLLVNLGDEQRFCVLTRAFLPSSATLERCSATDANASTNGAGKPPMETPALDCLTYCGRVQSRQHSCGSNWKAAAR